MARLTALLLLVFIFIYPVFTNANENDSVGENEQVEDIDSDTSREDDNKDINNEEEEEELSESRNQEDLNQENNIGDDTDTHESESNTEDNNPTKELETKPSESSETDLNKNQPEEISEDNHSNENNDSKTSQTFKIQSSPTQEDIQSEEQSADTIYQDAVSENRITYKLDLFIKGYESYPEDSRFITGVEEASKGLLTWARGKHTSGDYATAMDRYNRLLNETSVSDRIKDSAQMHLTYAENQQKILSADSYLSELNKLSKVSNIFNRSVEGYILYPEDQKRFRGQLNNATRQLLDWAKGKHEEGQFETAKDRYDLIISSDNIEQRFKDEATDLYQAAESGRRSSDTIYNEAQKENRISYKLDLFLEGYNSYPEDSRFITGVEEASVGLLTWARGKHNSGDYETAIDRYNRLLNEPSVSEGIKETAQMYLTYAQNQEKILSADSYLSKIKKLSKVSDIFNRSVEAYYLYPEDKRFRDQLNIATGQLLDWAKSKHEQGEFQIAKDRYDMIISNDNVDRKYRKEAAVLYQDAEMGKRSANAIFNSIQKETTASGLFELNKEGLNFYPNDSRFINGLKTSSKKLLDLATRYHNESNYQDAATRYNDLLSTNGVPNNIIKEAEFQLRYSIKGKKIPTAEEYASYASQLSTVSGRVDAFLEGFEYYDRHMTMKEGLLDSARAMLDWATLRHNEGEYSTAIDRYNIILNLPVSDPELVQETQIQKEYATSGERLPDSDQLYNEAINSSKASYQLDKFIKGYTLFPDQKRFSDGISTSSKSLLNLASRYHREGNYHSATDRYETILDSPAVPYLVRLESELRLNYSKNNTTIPTANSLYNKTLKESTASGIFDGYVEGYIFYPEDERFLIGIKVSSYNLYNYAFGLHQNRDFSGSIVRYQKLKNTPQVPEYIVESSIKNIELAEQNKIPSVNPINYTDYNISLDEAVAIQMKSSPQTDKHYGYVSTGYINNGKVTASNTLNVRSGPGTNYSKVGQLTSGENVKVLSEANGWYQIEYRSGQWVHAAEADVKYYMDPLNFINDSVQRFQFLDLARPSDASVVALNRFLEGKGILSGKGASFIEASLIHGVSDVYLVSHALLETGNGTSDLATGIEVGKDKNGNLTLVTAANRSSLTNIKTTYNMYGIGAVDNNAREGGAFTAYQRDWFTPESAIVGGATFIGNNYIKSGQNTLYKMRWNPQGMDYNGYATHQYATDIGWAYKQVTTMYNLYEQLDSYVLYLDIPRYK